MVKVSLRKLDVAISVWLVLALIAAALPAALGSDQVARSLLELKKSLSPVQAKFSSSLWGEIGLPVSAALGRILHTNPSRFWAEDLIEVEIIGEVSDGLLDFIQDHGVLSFVSHRFRSITASLPAPWLKLVANFPGILRVTPPGKAGLWKDNVSQGVPSHRVDFLGNVTDATGAGVKVGVLSDSVNFLQQVQASGDLPQVTVLDDIDASGEGTAMLEIVHDMSPGAELFFATAFKGQASFAENILALADAGCRVIVDDVYYFGEEVYSDGNIAQAVDEVAQRGVFYFSSAGNSGSFDRGSSLAWEGNYKPSPLPPFFSGYQDVQLFGNSDHLVIDAALGEVSITLHWADDFDNPEADYDLFITNNTGGILGSSVSRNQAFEIVTLTSDSYLDYTVYVARFSGTERMLSIRVHGGDSIPLLSPNTNGVLFGHTAAKGAFSMAAIAALPSGSFFEVNQTGGFLETEKFTSQGPRRVFFENGVPITPGDFTTSGGELRLKPDFATADGVTTATPGFAPFFGTSAAAPHAAGLAAVMLSEFPGILPADLRKAGEATALDIHGPAWDDVSGSGILDAILLREGVLNITLCSPNPCDHGGICSPEPPDGFVCDCSNTGYTGPFCNEDGPTPSPNRAAPATRPVLEVTTALAFVFFLAYFFLED